MLFGCLIVSMLIAANSYGFRIQNTLSTRLFSRFRSAIDYTRNVHQDRWNSIRLSSSGSYDFDEDNPPIVNPKNGDELLTGLNGMQDISVRVVNCRELVQEAIIRSDLSSLAARAVGEVTTCALMMGSNLKGKESLQVALVGNGGMKNIMAITDGQLQVRCRVGDNRYHLEGGGVGFALDKSDEIVTETFIGDVGQIQITRNHPTWKQPQCGIVQLDTKKSIPLNLSIYMGESEQRAAAMITDIEIEGNLCRRALGVMVEALPGATEQNIEKAIANLQEVKKRSLKSYLSLGGIEWQQKGEFRDYFTALTKIVSDCLENVELDEHGELLELDQGISWSKFPTFRCTCGIDRVWRTIALLPPSEVKDVIAKGDEVEVKCDFCGQVYKLGIDEIKAKFEDKTE